MVKAAKRAKKQGAGVKFSISKQILDAFNDAKDGKLTGKPIKIGTLTAEGKKFLEELSGLKMKDNIDFRLNPSDLVHIYNDHYGNNEKDKGNNIPLTDNDIQRMVDVIAYPTDVVYGEDKQGRKLFYFLRQEPNGAYNLLEIYADRKGNLTTKTYYKTKKGVSQRVMEIQSLLPTSKTYSGSTLSNTKIPQLFDIPKEPSEKNNFRLSYNPPFYSNAERAVEGIKQDKATPQQWLAMIDKAGGLKAGEDKWLGLSDWLKSFEIGENELLCKA